MILMSDLKHLEPNDHEGEGNDHDAGVGKL